MPKLTYFVFIKCAYHIITHDLVTTGVGGMAAVVEDEALQLRDVVSS